MEQSLTSGLAPAFRTSSLPAPVTSMPPPAALVMPLTVTLMVTVSLFSTSILPLLTKPGSLMTSVPLYTGR